MHLPAHLASLRQPFVQLVAILLLRLLPFAVHAPFARGVVRWKKALAVAAYVALPVAACLLGAASSAVFAALGCLYYLLVCLGMNRLSRMLGARRITRSAVVVLLFVAFLLIPGVLLPGVAELAFLVVGWELALRAYSYCVETSLPGRAPPPLGESLFFLLVNPTLVYTARGKPVSDPAGARGLVRSAAGAAVVFVNLALLTPAVAALRHVKPLSAGPLTAIEIPMLLGLLQFLALYAAHSGLASVQIGAMRQIGWVVPERYRYPFAATSPMDFWRRWNTYFFKWLEAYVYLPLALRAARSHARRWRQLAIVLVTLVASGLIHDAFSFAGRQNLSMSRTAFFLSAGLLLGAWRLAGALGDAVRRRLDAAPGRFTLVARWSGRIGLAGVVVAGAAAWGR
jgi:hypothetical protein